MLPIISTMSGFPQKRGGQRRLRDQSCQGIDPLMKRPQTSPYLDWIVVFVLGCIVGSMLVGLLVEFIK